MTGTLTRALSSREFVLNMRQVYILLHATLDLQHPNPETLNSLFHTRNLFSKYLFIAFG